MRKVPATGHVNDTISTSDFSSKHSYYGTRSICLLAKVTAFPRHKPLHLTYRITPTVRT